MVENSWMFEGDSKFLNNTDEATTTVFKENNAVVYTSYPRMGQSFLRQYLQKITGVATGCEMNLDFNLDQQLSAFKGEEVTDDSVWIKKSHWPMVIPGNNICYGNKVLICVRNPYDQLVSHMHFCTAFVQSGQFNEPFSNFADDWDRFLRSSAHDIANFHKYVIDNISNKVPTYWIRYEDLRLNPYETLQKVFCFLLDVESIEGTNIQKRIKEITNQGHEVSVAYKQKIESFNLNEAKPEQKPLVFNRNIKEFTPSQQEYVNKVLKEYMQMFNYCTEVKDSTADLYTHTPEWLQEQQSLFNFAKYNSVDESLMGKMDELNEIAMKQVISLRSSN